MTWRLRHFLDSNFNYTLAYLGDIGPPGPNLAWFPHSLYTHTPHAWFIQRILFDTFSSMEHLFYGEPCANVSVHFLKEAYTTGQMLVPVAPQCSAEVGTTGNLVVPEHITLRLSACISYGMQESVGYVHWGNFLVGVVGVQEYLNVLGDAKAGKRTLCQGSYLWERGMEEYFN